MRTRSDASGQASPQVLYILLALLDAPRHGYAIMREIEERTGGEVTLLPTSLYATIHRMLAEGLVQEAPEHDAGATTPGRPRKSYRITAAGRALAAQELRRMAILLQVARDKDPASAAVPGAGGGG